MESTVSPHILALDDDADIRETLDVMLSDEGFVPHLAASLPQALEFLDTHTVDLVLTDLFGQTKEGWLASIQPLLEKAHPTPVAICSARPLRADDDVAAFAFVLAKPFDIQTLLTAIAATLEIPLNPTTDTRAALAHRYFAALSAKDWDALIALCRPDIVYVLPGESLWADTINGQAAFRQFSEQTFQQFADAQFTDIRVYPTPKGMAARYVGQWTSPDGSTSRLSGAVTFHVVDGLIQQIGVQLNTRRLPHPQHSPR